MIDSKESKKEKLRIKKSENRINDIQRNDEKKRTLNLSEIPNLINEETQYYGKPENGISSIANNNHYSLIPGLVYPKKFQDSFLNEPISHNKEESRSSLEELRDLLRETNNEKENESKSIGKKDKKQKLHSKRKNSSIEKMVKIKFKEKDNNDKNSDEIKIKKKNYSHRKRSENDLDEEQNTEKIKGADIKFRKSEIIRLKDYDTFSAENRRKKNLFFHKKLIVPIKSKLTIYLINF